VYVFALVDLRLASAAMRADRSDCPSGGHRDFGLGELWAVLALHVVWFATHAA
jgi:hypothetical protein